MNELISWLIPLLLGYIFGRLHHTTNKELTTKITTPLKRVEENISQLTKQTSHSNKKYGAVEMYSAQEEYLRANPLIKEEIEEMDKAFSQIKGVDNK